MKRASSTTTNNKRQRKAGSGSDQHYEQRFPIVGIGASAGGLAALKRFFEFTPVDTGMAFVVVTHLDPRHASHMPELLTASTTMAVVQAEDGMIVQPNSIYVIRPDCSLTIDHGRLWLGQMQPRATRLPIDEFLVSLARDQRECAVAVILTGAGSDGSRGLREVKREGGLVLVQDPNRAEHDGMPGSAVATGMVDRVAPVEDLPELLIDYIDQARPHEDSPKDELDGPELERLLQLLKERADYDFGWYKRATVLRRLRRRMALSGKTGLRDYLESLYGDGDEVALLVNDLLIGVTAFFREADAWKMLADEILPRIVAAVGDSRPVRVWVPGCSTGEEAYTIAMLLVESLGERPAGRAVQVFATDVDEAALDFARAGLYSERAIAAVSAERRDRFFTREAEQYRVRKGLRELIVFAHQNVISDSPFSRLDLITCRNLLIYLEQPLQNRVLSVFHFVLNDGGYLMLGNSETIGKHTAMFEPVSKKWRLYRRIGTSRRPPTDLPGPRASSSYAAERGSRGESAPRRAVAELARDLLLDHFVPAAVVVDRAGEIRYYHGSTDLYLAPPSGEPTNKLIDLARRGLRGPLRHALHRAGQRPGVVITEIARVQRDKQSAKVRVTVTRQSAQGREGLHDHLLVVFEDVAERPGQAAGSEEQPGDTVEHALVAQLEEELKRTKEELQSTIEELETANEELKVSNEEAMSMNEELQSTNEELETSKEELQSLNEELITINNQLEEKIGALQAANDDLDNLFSSTNIATIFLDRDLRIKRFTPATTELMSLIGTDVGRPIGDIASRVGTEELIKDARRVLANLHSAEQEIQTGEQWFLRRTLPYRTLDDRIEGVVVTFIEITERKRHEQDNARLAAIVGASEDAIISIDAEGTVLSWNAAAERSYGYSATDAVGADMSMIVPPEHEEDFKSLLRELKRGKGFHRVETARMRKDGRRLEVAVSASAIRDRDGKPLFFSTVERNITDVKTWQREVLRLNRDLQRRLHELQTVVDVAPVGISLALDPECRTITTNALASEMMGVAPDENISLSGDEAIRLPYDVFFDGKPLAPSALPMQRAARDGVHVRNMELELVFRDGRRLELLMSAAPLLDEQGKPRGAVGAFLNIAERKQAEARLRQNEARLREQAVQLVAADQRKDTFLAVLGHELRNPLAPIRNVVDLLRAKPELEPTAVRKGVEVIDRQVRQLTRLVDDLLDVARITRDDMRLQRERLNLGELCARLLASMQPLFDSRSQTVRYEQASDDLYLNADPVRVEQIVGNLMHNASNYTPEGGNIWLRLEQDRNDALIYVRDDGAGIGTQDQHDIFDPFSRAASALAHSGKTGLGLGLTLAKRLVQMHGGSIDVYSEGAGHGTEFTVRLPLALAESEPAHPAAQGSAAPRGQRRILLVEDNADVSDALSTLLKALGHEVRVVATGSDAVPCARDFQPEVAFIDIGLPDIDGYEVARRLRSDARATALLVALSGYGQSEGAAAKPSPFDEYLLKPLSFDRIGEILARVP